MTVAGVSQLFCARVMLDSQRALKIYLLNEAMKGGLMEGMGMQRSGVLGILDSTLPKESTGVGTARVGVHSCQWERQAPEGLWGRCLNSDTVRLGCPQLFLKSCNSELATFYLYPDFSDNEFASSLKPPYRKENRTIIKWHFVRLKQCQCLTQDR